MANIYAITGGSSTAQFPHTRAASKCACPEFCSAIDGRFSSPHGFALPSLFNPGNSEYLRKFLVDGAVAAGDIIWRGYIPARHCTRSLGLIVQEMDESCCPDRRCRSGNAEGAEIGVVWQKLDVAAFCESGDCSPDAHLKGSATELASLDDLTTSSFAKFPLNQTVQDGEVLLIGFKVNAMPADPDALPYLNTIVSAMVNGDNFCTPLQID